MRNKMENETRNLSALIRVNPRQKLLLYLFVLFLIPFTLMSQSVGITGDSTINQCETKTYTISIQNNSGNPLDHLVITALLENFTGFSYVNGTTSIDVDGGGAFCTADPTISGGYAGTCLPAPSAPYLTWNIDTLCGSFTLNDGETLNISFNLETDCTAVSGSLNTYIDYEIGGTPFCDDTGAHSIQVLPGGVTIKKTDNVIPQYLGQDVTWTLTIENTGFGVIENVVVTDVLDSGLTYVSSTPAGDNSGQTTTWDSTEIAGLASMDPGTIITIDITATVTACQNLNNEADVRWGCDMVTDCYNTADTIPPSTAEASVERIPRTPLLDYTPPPVTFTYCDDDEDVNFTITNTGDGTAHEIWILVDFGGLTVSNVSAGAVYNAAEHRFELTAPIAPTGTYDLSYTLNYSAWCGGGFPAGETIWQDRYLDECDQEFYPPIKLSTVNTPTGSTSVSVTKAGAGEAIQIGAQVTYNITSAYSGPLNCGSGPGTVSDITVVDTIPDGFTVVDAGGGTWVPGGGGTGGTITWTYTPPASLTTSIILQSPDRTQCETYCFTTFTNSITADGIDCCGCALNASASETTAIECEEFVNSNKSANPVTQERCANIEYTNTYDFGAAGILLNTLNFTEHAENQQQYVPGSLSVTYDGGDITGCVAVTDTTPGGTFYLDFSGCAADLVDTKNLTIVYQLTITEATAAACSGSSFYSWSTLDMGPTGSECLQDGLIRETTLVSTQPPSMSLDISGLASIVDQCQTHTITLTLTQTSTVATPKDVRLVLSGLNYYVVNPVAAVCSGAVAPTSCTPTIVGDDYVWYFADGFAGSGQNAVIQLDVRKRCGGGGDLVATAYYDDLCNDDGSYDDTCSTTATETPAILRTGDLLIEKNPETYYAATNTLEWKIYVTNRGTGTAYYVWVDDVLGAGLDYQSAVVDDMTGVTVTADQDHEGTAINGCTISIEDMTPGERRAITLTALLVDCDNLTNDATTSWGCNALDCQTPVSDSSIAEIPRPLLLNTNVVTTPADACSDPNGFITLRNAGQTTCYNLQITENLPEGLIYVAGSTRWRLNSGAWNGPDSAYDPTVSGSPEQLDWTSTEIAGLTQSDPGDTIEIEFDMEADCPFGGGDVTVVTRYENPCGQVFNTDNSVFTVAFREPDVTINKTRANDPIDCNQAVQWTITVTNNSGYTLPIIWIEDTLDAAYTYVSSVGDPPFTSDDGTNAGQLVTWELRNVNHGDTVTLTLNATSDSAPCSPDLDNTVVGYWGCGLADGSSATKPGQDAPDDSLCITSTGVTDVRTETRQPNLGYLSIAMFPGDIDACNDSTQLTIVLENTGPVDAYTIDLAITLPPGITYNAGSAESGLGTDQASATAAIGAIGDPAVSGSTITFYDFGDKGSNIAAAIQAASGNDTLVLRFTVQSACYTTANMNFDLRYYDCCDDTQYSTTSQQQLTALFPSLTVTKTADLAQVDCGNNVEYTITVTNNGTGNAEVVRVVDTLGDWLDYAGNFTEDHPGTVTPAVIGGNPQVIGWEFVNLGPGATYTFTFEATLNPDGLPNQNDCTDALRQNNVTAQWACGTAGDAVDDNPNTTGYDCTDSGSAAAGPVTLEMPDLHITDITALIDCTVAGDGNFSGTVTVTVENQGDGDTLSGFTISVTDGTWTGTGTTGVLAAGTSRTVTIDTTGWSPNCNGCAAYTLDATVDTVPDVCECDESNNTYSENYTAPIADLVVNSITPTCTSDGRSQVIVNIGNTGCTNITSPFTVHLEDDQGNSDDITVNSLNTGANTDVTFTNWPTTCSPATINFTATADYNDDICECDGVHSMSQAYNNTSPDLEISTISPAASCSTDGTFSGTIQVQVTNSGNGAAGADFRIAVNDGQGWTSELWYNADLGGTLPLGAGASDTVTFNWTRAFTAEPYTCNFPTITVTADSQDDICECSNASNADTDSYTLPYSNLRVLSVTPSCTDDGSYSIEVVVDNNGCANATGVVVQLSDNDGQTQSQTISLNAGASQTLTFAPWPADGNPASLIFTAVIDPSSAICELSGADNSANTTYARANLNLVSITPSCVSDGTFQVSVVIENDGSSAINTDFVVRLTDNDGHTQDQNFTAVGGTLPLNNGTQQTVVFNNWPVDGNPVTINFTGELDPTDQVCESIAGDNTNTGTFTIYNLDAVSVIAAVSCTADGTITGTVAVTITNSGGNAINTDFQVLVNDGQGWTSELFFQANLGGTLPLAAGATETVTFNWTRNFTAVPYVCNFPAISASVDSQNAICEAVAADNQVTGNYTLTMVDLTIDSVASSIICNSDGSLTGTTVTVGNTGCSAAVGVIVRLTSDCGLTFSDQTVDLAAGATEDVFFPFTAGITNCNCTFTAEIDPDDAICEIDGTNNTGISTTTMLIPDIEVQSETLAIDCMTDGVIRVSGSVTLLNNGCGPNFTDNIPMRFTLFDHPGCGGSQTAQWTETFTGVDLASSGGTQTFTIQPHTIAANLCTNAITPNCRVSIRIEADYSNGICEWDGTDNTYCADISSQCLDLEATSITPSTNCTADGTMNGTIAVTITNSGGSPITDDFSVRVDDGQGWISERRYNADLGGTLPLAAGASSTVTFNWNRDFSGATCEIAVITAEVDSQNNLCQCTTENDTVTADFQLTPPNLRPTAIAPDCSGDGTYNVRVTVENNGCSSAGAFTVHLEDSLGNNRDIIVNSISAGESYAVEFAGWPASCAPSSVTFTAVVDYNNQVCEINGSDNTSTYLYTNTSPDLIFTQIVPSTTCSSAGNVSGFFDITVRNNGNAPVTNDFKVTIDDGEGWSTELYYQADLKGTLPIAVGQTVTLRANWNRSFTGTPYTCDFNNIAAGLDMETGICECAAGNNDTVVTYHLPYPDLEIQSLLPICHTDGVQQLQVIVGNKGCEDQKEDFNITFSDSSGQTVTVPFTTVGGKLPLKAGTTQTLTLAQWTFNCASGQMEYTASIDTHIADLLAENNFFTYSQGQNVPDLVMDDITWTCNGDGSISFTITVANNGFADAGNVPVAVYDGNGQAVYSQSISLAAGASTQLTFTTASYPAGQNLSFRFVVDENENVCECNGGNNEKSTIVNCPSGGEPPLKLSLFCPPGQGQGGLFLFEIKIENTGSVDLPEVTVNDLLPEYFQYVTGSSVLNGQAIGDPQISDNLTWSIGTLPSGASWTLLFTAIADSDIDPGRYCTQSWAKAILYGDSITSSSNRVECCTVVTRETAAGCCLNVEEWLMDRFHKPEGPVSFIEPYFHTESAMFTVYSIFNLWRDLALEKDGMPLFMKERLQNYARSVIEEFYLFSHMGLTLPDGSLRLSFGGGYPEHDSKDRQDAHSTTKRWARKLVDETMTASQIAYELLALNEAVKVEDREDIKNKLSRIIEQKLVFIQSAIDDLPHGWEFKKKKTDHKDDEKPEYEVKKLDAKATLYDKVSLYLAMVELTNSSNPMADNLGREFRGMLKSIDDKSFDQNNLREEFIFILALLKSRETQLAADKISAFEGIFAVDQHGQSRTKDKEDLLKSLHDYALAAAVDQRAGGNLYPEIVAEMKDRYYLNDTGIFADKQPDFTFKMSLDSLAPLILLFDVNQPQQQEQYALNLYRTFDEVGLFLKKRNLVIGKPLYSMLKNYPFSEPLLPVLSFTKAQRSIAPVFSRDAVVHSTQVKPLGEIQIPGAFSKILSPVYETQTSRIADISFALQYFGKTLMENDQRVIKEEGRSFTTTGRKYVDSLLLSGAGLQQDGLTFLPFDTIAVKGPKKGEHNLVPVNAGSGSVFSSEALANYMSAEKLYVEGAGKHADDVKSLMAVQTRIVEAFKKAGYIPEKFNILFENDEIAIVPSKGKASKITIARLFHVLPKDKEFAFLESALKKAEGLAPEDLIFLSAAPELVPYFKKEIKEIVDYKDSRITYNAADIIGRRLLGQSQGIKESLDNLLKNWDKEAVLPKSDRIDTIEKGIIYHHEPRQLILYLLAAAPEQTSPVDEPDSFRFKRTLNFFTYLLENEWGLEWNSYIKLPSAEYQVFREEPRDNIEPGDLLNFRVRVDNTCPQGFGRGRDLPSLFLKADFSPSLVYTGTEPVEGLSVLDGFRWQYDQFPEGSLLEYTYQAFVPYQFNFNSVDGKIYAGGRQGFEDFGPDSASGDYCEDIGHARRLNFMPLYDLHGLVFEDRNVNGIKDVGEPGIAGITIKDTLGRLFTSDGEGRFTVFAGSEHEGIQLELKSLPPEYVLLAAPTQLVNRYYTGDIYFPLIPCKTVKGFVYADENQNGAFDEGESKPAGVLLKAGEKEVLTTTGGSFIFRNIPVLWQEWIEIGKIQLFYKAGETGNLKISIDK